MLAARSAAAQRMMNSLSADQRAELAALTEQAFGDARLAQSLAQLDGMLQQLRPGQDWDGSGRFRGDNPMGMGEATRAIEELGRLESLASSWPRATREPASTTSTWTCCRRCSASRPGWTPGALAELERELREQGILRAGGRRVAAAVAQGAAPARARPRWRDVADRIGGRTGERETRRSGAAGDATGATRPWEFGDTEPWSVPRTLLNAQLRRAGGDDRVLDVTDVEIVETERRTRAAVALCVDTSWSMVQEGRWVPMKRTALALHQLISTRFRARRPRS